MPDEAERPPREGLADPDCLRAHEQDHRRLRGSRFLRLFRLLQAPGNTTDTLIWAVVLAPVRFVARWLTKASFRAQGDKRQTPYLDWVSKNRPPVQVAMQFLTALLQDTDPTGMRRLVADYCSAATHKARLMNLPYRSFQWKVVRTKFRRLTFRIAASVYRRHQQKITSLVPTRGSESG